MPQSDENNKRYTDNFGNTDNFKMPREEEHTYYMLLHDMIDITICQNGWAFIKYHPHMSKEVRTMLGYKNVEEQIHEIEYQEGD